MEMDRKGGTPRSQELPAASGSKAPEADTSNDLANATITSPLSSSLGEQFDPRQSTETFAARHVGTVHIGHTTMTVEHLKVDAPLTVAA